MYKTPNIATTVSCCIPGSPRDFEKYMSETIEMLRCLQNNVRNLDIWTIGIPETFCLLCELGGLTKLSKLKIGIYMTNSSNNNVYSIDDIKEMKNKSPW